MASTCKRGMIRRSAYTRKSGVRVGAKCVRNMGEAGKWTVRHRNPASLAAGIGRLRSGRLARFGYNTSKTNASRRRALGKAVKSEGRTAVLRMLQAVATYTKRTNPAKSKLFLADRAAVAAMK